MDIVVPGNSQLQWSIIGSDMPSALGLVFNVMGLEEEKKEVHKGIYQTIQCFAQNGQ